MVQGEKTSNFKKEIFNFNAVKIGLEVGACVLACVRLQHRGQQQLDPDWCLNSPLPSPLCALTRPPECE